MIILINIYHMLKSPGCRADKLMVSPSGNPSLEDAALYCGTGYFKMDTIQNKIVIGKNY